MSTVRFSCVTPAPSSPGTIRRNSCRIRGVMRGRGMRTGMPARDTDHTSKASCNTPEPVTPQASACPTVGTKGVRANMHAIDTVLNTTGAAAAAANRSSPFSTPDSSAVRQIRIT